MNFVQVTAVKNTHTACRKTVKSLFNLLAPELFFLILAHSVYKM